MKRIVKFIGPNGEYVEWGEFDERKRILTFEVKKFNDDGVLMETEQVEFSLPDKLDLESAWQTKSSYRGSGFRKTDAPEQGRSHEDKSDEREILHD